MASLNPKGVSSAARLQESSGPPDLRELQGSASRRFLEQSNPQIKKRESSADEYGQKLQMLNFIPDSDEKARLGSLPPGVGSGASSRQRERGGSNLQTFAQAPEPRSATPYIPAGLPHQNAWTQMSINCIMKCGIFSSDQMLTNLNERAFALTQSAIIKQASGIAEHANLHNGINL